MQKYPRAGQTSRERRAELIRELLASVAGGSVIQICVAPPSCDAVVCKRPCGDGRPPHDPALLPVVDRTTP